jgi:CheY-like chemotaxis protein
MNVLLFVPAVVDQAMLGMFLSEKGHTVRSVKSADEALQFLGGPQRAETEIAVIDSAEPLAATVIEHCQRPTEDGQIPIALVVDSNREATRGALDLGAIGYLCRPRSAEEKAQFPDELNQFLWSTGKFEQLGKRFS